MSCCDVENLEVVKILGGLRLHRGDRSPVPTMAPEAGRSLRTAGKMALQTAVVRFRRPIPQEEF